MAITPMGARAGTKGGMSTPTAASPPAKRSNRRTAAPEASSAEVPPQMAPQQFTIELMKLFRQSQQDQLFFDENTEAINDHADKLERLKDGFWKIKRRVDQLAAELTGVTHDVINNDVVLKDNLKRLEEKFTGDIQRMEERMTAMGKAVVENDATLKENLRKLEETITLQGKQTSDLTAASGSAEPGVKREEVVAWCKRWRAGRSTR